MKNEWYNNEISKKLYNECQHNFSICDIDGICRCFYKENGKWKIRFIIYESKYFGERLTKTQLDTLYELDKNIKWENFDNRSGVFILFHNELLDKLDVYKIKNESNTIKPILKLIFIETITWQNFNNWISAAEFDRDYGFNNLINV